jgi:CRISPR-associated exonuclease Cas4
MPIRSLELGLSGKTDAVEYGADGSVVVVEYKRGRPKSGGADEVQLCAQALCLEEMRGITIPQGALFYGKTKRRKAVSFDTALRERTRQTVSRVHALLRAGKTPLPVYGNSTCPRCSLLGYCMPKKLSKASPVKTYFSRMLKEEAPK